EQAIEEPGRMAKQTEFLLQINVDAAQEDALVADVRLIGAQRRVGGDKERIVSLTDEGGRQGVVVQAGAAEHPAGSCRDVGDLHGSSLTPLPPASSPGAARARRS